MSIREACLQVSLFNHDRWKRIEAANNKRVLTRARNQAKKDSK